MIELRSDTFSLPTAEMRKAMNDAVLGDDVYGEDPTVRELEDLAADLLGKSAACLTPSGTMANLTAIMAYAPRGTKTLVGVESDIYLYEAGGAAVCGGVTYEPIPQRPDGGLLASALEGAFPVDPEDPQFALPSLICVENTQNRCGGAVLPRAHLAEVRRIADAHGLPVHLDGARIFNAAAASGVPAADIAGFADSVQFCLSKGLSAPIGSIVVGDPELMQRVRRARKMLGGGMRQAGVIAAAGLVALRNLDHLHEDHANARRLAEGLGAIDGIRLATDVQTNIVMFRVTDRRFTWQTFVAAAAARGLTLAELGHGRIRAVTHSGVTSRDIDAAVAIVKQLMADGPVP
jgi:threonine aldolase